MQAATIVIPKSFLVALISQFDAFIGRLIRTMYLALPQKLDASSRQISFSDLVGFGTIDAAREFILEKEVETVLRQSHAEHFEWLEKQLGITVRPSAERLSCSP